MEQTIAVETVLCTVSETRSCAAHRFLLWAPLMPELL